MNSQRKRLLILFYDLGVGGIQRRLVDIIEYLQTQKGRKNVEVTLYIKSYSGNQHNQEYIERVLNSGARIIYRPRWTAGPFRIATVSHVLWTILKVRPDVILTYLRLLSVGIVGCSRLLWWRKTKVVLNEGILTSELLKDEVPEWTRNIWKSLMKWAYPRADRVIVPTLAVKKDLIDNFQVSAKNIVISPHWTLLGEQTQSELKRKDTPYNLIYIGRLEPQKNLGMLLHIVRSLKIRNPTLKVCVVGTGSLEDHLRQKAGELYITQEVDFVGRQDNVLPFLKRSQIFILTSFYEGMPVALLEAKALGIPAVISNYPGAKEVVKNGKDGYICRTKEEFVERTSSLISNDNLREQLGRFARKRVKQEFGAFALSNFCASVLN